MKNKIDFKRPKEKYIGVKVSKSEYKKITKFANKNKVGLSEAVRVLISITLDEKIKI